MKHLTLISIIFFLCFDIANAAHVFMHALTIQPSIFHTRFIFTLSDKTYGKIKSYTNPDRVFVDFAHTHKNFTLQNTKLGEGNVISIQDEQKNNSLRFILFVKGKVHWTTKFLPVENASVRFQLDIISDDQKILPKKTITKINVPDAASVTSHSPIQKIFQNDIHKVAKPVMTIVIDPGHGGKDPGARGRNGAVEKDVVLSLSKILANKINQQANLRAILTRNNDSYLPLRDRLKLARKQKADVFIAIHADAFFNDATGASVFALSEHGASNEASRWLAQRENYSELGEVSLDELKDRDPLVRSVLVDLAQSSTINQSIRLGDKVLDALDDISRLHFNRVERAPFVVLKSPDIPSILVETGFISNPFEEQRLITETYQEQIAEALFKGIEQYVKTYQN